MLDTAGIAHTLNSTNSIEELEAVITKNLAEGCFLFLFAGGDGTLHHGGNFLIKHAGEFISKIVIGVLPCGTGNDWVRTFGMAEAHITKSLKEITKTSLNILEVEFPNGRKRYAFNMIGGALDAAVVDSLNRSTISLPGALKYPFALMKTLMKPHQWKGTVHANGKTYEGDWLTIQAGFGKYCGGGMYVLPHANSDQAALLLMKPKSLGKLITSLPKLYNGKIADQEEAIATHFSLMEINHASTPIPLEADGEWLGTSPAIIRVKTGVLNRLAINP